MPSKNAAPKKEAEHADLVNETRRLTAQEIFHAAVENAREELKRSVRTLAFSGLAGGLTMGLTGLGVASVRAMLGDGAWAQFVSYLVYPIGFVAVIIGRAQLFTENTLYPVVLILDERKHLLRTLRLWAVVFSANVLGAFFFAVIATRTGALKPLIVSKLISLGLDAVTGPASYFSGAESSAAGSLPWSRGL